MGVCRSCGAEIFWQKMKSGKVMPVNKKMVPFWADKTGKASIVTPTGDVVRCRLDGERNEVSGFGHVSHFATCPHARSHRKKK